MANPRIPEDVLDKVQAIADASDKTVGQAGKALVDELTDDDGRPVGHFMPAVIHRLFAIMEGASTARCRALLETLLALGVCDPEEILETVQAPAQWWTDPGLMALGQGAPRYIVWLEDASPDIRVLAALALAYSLEVPPAAAEALLRQVAREEDTGALATLLFALGATGGRPRECVGDGALRKAPSHKKPLVRARAAAGLVLLNPDSVPPSAMNVLGETFITPTP